MTDTQLKAVLFDMDDTLIDWSGFDSNWAMLERRHLRGVYDFLAEQGHTLKVEFDVFCEAHAARAMQAWDEARSTLRAPHIGTVLQQTLTHFGFEANGSITQADILEAYRWDCVPGVDVFPDVPEALQYFTQRGVTLGIITNSSQPIVLRDRELAGYGLLEYFPQQSHRITAADVGYLKPHPRIFEHALDVVAAKPEEVVYIGDNPSADIAGAQQAGMKAVLRVNAHQSRLASTMVTPDGRIKALTELYDLLDEWYGDW